MYEEVLNVSVQYKTLTNYFLIYLKMEFLDARVAEEIKAELLSLIDETQQSLIVIDLSELGFIDSSGFGVLIACLQSCKLKKKELILASLAPQAKQCFRMLNLDKLFKISETLPA